MKLIPLDKAAEKLETTPADLTQRVQRGLQKATGIDGEWWFDPADLAPPKKASAPALTRKQRLQEEAAVLGIDHSEKTTADELEEAIAAHLEE